MKAAWMCLVAGWFLGGESKLALGLVCRRATAAAKPSMPKQISLKNGGC